MRLVFMGTPAFVIPVLQVLLDTGHQVVGVYTQPDKPTGRGREPETPPVKGFALARGLPVFQPTTLRRPEAAQQLRALAPEALVVAAYGKLLPPEVLAVAPLGCLNLHPSLLPRHRGPSPVITAILEGDQETGVTIMLMDEGMDTGPILAQVREPINPEDTAEILTQRLFQVAAPMLVGALERWVRGEIHPTPQDPTKASVTHLVEKAHGQLDFTLPATVLWRKVRAYQPWPTAHTTWRGRLLKVLDASPIVAEAPGPVGTVVALDASQGLPAGIVTGEGVLGLKRLHLEGKRPVSCREFLQGYQSFLGARLPS